MDGLAYCRERALAPGSRLYFAHHFLDPGIVPKLVVLHALFGEVASIPERASDISVASTKLGWWHEEIQRCWQGDSRHPISQAAQAQGIMQFVSAEDMVRLVRAVADWIDPPPVASFDELFLRCAAIGGLAGQLEAQVCTAESQCLDAAGQIGTAHYMVALIRDIGMDARAGRCHIPMDLQARYQFSRDHAATGEATGEFRDLVASLTEKTVTLLEAAIDSLAPPQQRQLRHLVIQAALDQKLITKMQANPHKILQQRMKLSSFASLWNAWLAARRPGVD